MEQPPCPLQLPVPGASLAADQRWHWLHNDVGPFTDLLAEEAKPQAKPNPVEAGDFGGLVQYLYRGSCVTREGMTFSSRLMMLAVNGGVKLCSTALGLGCRSHPAVLENMYLLFL